MRGSGARWLLQKFCVSPCRYLPEPRCWHLQAKILEAFTKGCVGVVQLSQRAVTLAGFHILREEILPWRKSKLPEQQQYLWKRFLALLPDLLDAVTPP